MRSASCQGHNNSTMEESLEMKIMVTDEKTSYQSVKVLPIKWVHFNEPPAN